jgi:hypothetical protein
VKEKRILKWFMKRGLSDSPSKNCLIDTNLIIIWLDMPSTHLKCFNLKSSKKHDKVGYFFEAAINFDLRLRETPQTSRQHQIHKNLTIPLTLEYDFSMRNKSHRIWFNFKMWKRASMNKQGVNIFRHTQKSLKFEFFKKSCSVSSSRLFNFRSMPVMSANNIVGR